MMFSFVTADFPRTLHLPPRRRQTTATTIPVGTWKPNQLLAVYAAAPENHTTIAIQVIMKIHLRAWLLLLFLWWRRWWWWWCPLVLPLLEDLTTTVSDGMPLEVGTYVQTYYWITNGIAFLYQKSGLGTTNNFMMHLYIWCKYAQTYPNDFLQVVDICRASVLVVVV